MLSQLKQIETNNLLTVMERGEIEKRVLVERCGGDLVEGDRESGGELSEEETGGGMEDYVPGA